MRFLSADEMRALDQAAMNSGTSGWTLMRRAGAAIARSVARLANTRGIRDVTVVVGRGNNGGDGCVAAEILHISGFNVLLMVAADPSTFAGDAQRAYDLALDSAVPTSVMSNPSDWDTAGEWEETVGGCVYVDALLGTGSHGAPRGLVAAAARWLERRRHGNLLLAVDIPTGLDADDGTVSVPCPAADFTLTIAAPKKGFLAASAQDVLGHVEVADIGLPRQVEAGPGDIGLATPLEFPDYDAPRKRDSHKGDFGHVLVAGGSRGFSGAPALAALGALRTGAGLVTAAVPDGCDAQVAALVPEAMTRMLPAADGHFAKDALDSLGCDLSKFDAVVIGPGMQANDATAEFLRQLLGRQDLKRIVLDADALNILAGDLAGCAKNGAPLFADKTRAILTPHPGEAARLLGVTTAEVQRDRIAAARELARRANATVVLKGAGTLVAAPDAPVLLNLTGNPGMATGGSGDVLSGVIAALWAQGLDARAAAAMGVFRHGSNGDFAAWRNGQRAILARDLAYESSR